MFAAVLTAIASGIMLTVRLGRVVDDYYDGGQLDTDMFGLLTMVLAVSAAVAVTLSMTLFLLRARRASAPTTSPG